MAKKTKKVSPIKKRLVKHLNLHRSMVSDFPISMNPLERVEQMTQMVQSS